MVFLYTIKLRELCIRIPYILTEPTYIYFYINLIFLLKKNKKYEVLKDYFTVFSRQGKLVPSYLCLRNTDLVTIFSFGINQG